MQIWKGRRMLHSVQCDGLKTSATLLMFSQKDAIEKCRTDLVKASSIQTIQFRKFHQSYCMIVNK